MGHGGYTLELSLKDSVSAGLKDMGRALSNVRELVGSLRADVSALNKESGQAVSGLDLGKLAEGAADQLEGLSKGALQELDAAFRDSGKTMADYYAERRRQAGETADMERENASEQAERMAQELEARVAQRTQALQNETDARKSMMLNIFHDLRSPLFAISSGLDTLEGFAFGGLIGGQDKGERADNVLIRATPGEYMLDRPTVRHYGVSALEALRRRSVPRELLEPFASPRLPASGGKRTAYALGGEIGNGSLTEGGKASGNEGLTVINVMDFQREFDRALASTRGRRVLINILGEEGIAS